MEYKDIKYSTESEIYDVLWDKRDSISQDISVYHEGPGELKVYCSKERSEDVLEVIQHSRARIVKMVVRGDNIFYFIYTGRSDSGEIYSSSMKKVEVSKYTTLENALKKMEEEN